MRFFFKNRTRDVATTLQKWRQEEMISLASGETRRIKAGTGIGHDQGKFIQQLISETNARRTLEIGFAWGFSASVILEQQKATEGSWHHAIDPFQTKSFGRFGEKVVKDFGFEKFSWSESYSVHELSRLAQKQEKFDLIFIDGGHLFDEILTDFYLSDMVLKDQGLMLFDDTWLKSTKLACEFISKNRHYDILYSDQHNTAVFKKIKDDDRNWDHFVDFC